MIYQPNFIKLLYLQEEEKKYIQKNAEWVLFSERKRKEKEKKKKDNFPMKMKAISEEKRTYSSSSLSFCRLEREVWGLSKLSGRDSYALT